MTPHPSVLIPFAGDDPDRLLSLAWVTARYESSGYEVSIGYGDVERWSKADAVEDALSKASGDLLIVADADVWCEELPLSIEAVDQGAPWSMPHWNVVRLTRTGTEKFFAGQEILMEDESEHHFGAPGGGIVVLTREMYERCPLDPRFVGWGGEDLAWGYALRTIAGKHARFHAGLWHFWHAPQARMTRKVGSEANETLRASYADSRFQTGRMRKLIAEGAQWRSRTSSPLR